MPKPRRVSRPLRPGDKVESPLRPGVWLEVKGDVYYYIECQSGYAWTRRRILNAIADNWYAARTPTEYHNRPLTHLERTKVTEWAQDMLDRGWLDGPGWEPRALVAT